MYDGLFIINSAISVDHLSIYDTDTRFNQTLETLESIDKSCPNNLKVIFDNSYLPMTDKQLMTIGRWPNTWFLDTGKHDIVKKFSLQGLRSLAETYAFMGALNWLNDDMTNAKRIYKLSGRYTLTDNFVLDDPCYNGSFVFADSLPSWMPKEQQEMSGVDRLYRLRLWHMDTHLLPNFKTKLPEIFYDCLTYGIDVEHAYYKHLHGYPHVEVNKIGVTGNIGPNGEHIDE